MASMVKTYSELITLPSFEERFEYLKENGSVGEDTFGYNRYMNQAFYQSREWHNVRNRIIARDMGCDLAMPDHPIGGKKIYVHHINPLTPNDIETGSRECLIQRISYVYLLTLIMRYTMEIQNT